MVIAHSGQSLLGADHHRDRELDQVPAHDEVLEARQKYARAATPVR
jgi:hypothetical protein